MTPIAPRLADDALDAFHADRARRNFRRMRTLLGFMAPMHLVFVAVFLVAKPGTDPVWRTQIAAAHLAMGAVGALVLATMWHPRLRDSAFAARVIPLALGLWYLVGGAVISAIDQQVTPAVHPFIEASIGVGIALRLSRRELLVGFLLDYAVFAAGIVLCQPDPSLRMSGLVNGFTAA
ncbi:MAG TPA: hypothetical protein VGI39_01705, partial [Polyangiaceae bacterium]